jgi:nucleoid-associated protein YgaU
MKSGAVASRVELPFFREEAARVAAAAPEAGGQDQAAQTAKPDHSAAGEAGKASSSGEPHVAEATAETAEQPRSGRIIIQPGNNLWKLSRVIYGKGNRYTVIYEANKDLIRDPDLIYPGQVFATPNVVPPERIDPSRRTPLSVEEGSSAAQ